MVGSHLLDYLIENTDWDITGMARWRSPLDNIDQHLNKINNAERITLNYADLRDGISIENLLEEVKPDYVFHLAAQSFPKTSFTSPIDTLDTNIQGTTRLLESCKRNCRCNNTYMLIIRGIWKSFGR